MAKTQPISVPPIAPGKKRLVICLGGGSVTVLTPLPDVEVEVRDYDVPEDWGGVIIKDGDGDRYQPMLFNDQGNAVFPFVGEELDDDEDDDFIDPDREDGDDDEDDDDDEFGPNEEEDEDETL